VPPSRAVLFGRWSWLRKGLTRILDPVAAFVSVGLRACDPGHSPTMARSPRRRRRGAGFDPSYTQLAERVKGSLGLGLPRPVVSGGALGRRDGAYRLFALPGRRAPRLLHLKLRQFERDPRDGRSSNGTIVDCGPSTRTSRGF